jgi:HPr kinase/phosphorylase
MMPQGSSIHASSVVIGDIAVLIRGPSGSGKSRLAFALILAGRAGQLPATKLVGDDRIMLEARESRLFVRPVPELAGLIEIYGLGIRRTDYVPEAMAGLIVDLNADDADRMPQVQALSTTMAGIELPRIPVKNGEYALPMIAAFFLTRDALGAACEGRLPEGNL